MVITNQVGSMPGTTCVWLCIAAVPAAAPEGVFLSLLHGLQVISDPSGGAMFVADPKKPGGLWRRWQGWVGRSAQLPIWFVAMLSLPCCRTVGPHQLPCCHAVGGHVLAHASTFRLSVRKGKAEQRLMKVRLLGGGAAAAAAAALCGLLGARWLGGWERGA